MRGLPSDPDDLAISTAVLGMAQTLKLKVMAEGVETKEQLDFLRLRGCDKAQGIYFSEPLSAEEFARFITQSEAVLPNAGCSRYGEVSGKISLNLRLSRYCARLPLSG